MTFNAEDEAERLSNKILLRRKKRYSRSKLDKWKPEILALKQHNCTLQAIQIWLKEKNISCQQSTISRWLKRNA